MSSVDLRSLSIYLVCGRMCVSSVCVCVLLSVEELFVNKQTFHLQEHQTVSVL
jgi:hypothetical protein